ncbi:hypothetical protein [Methylopila sp. 73B]|uniref:hypothetical protein n=1 Tax=Methylopila sp. 73B TaxID=1120792 RepID=UPI0003660C1A|nr:hypothetical protein [Methylopila sp. 73B]
MLQDVRDPMNECLSEMALLRAELEREHLSDAAYEAATSRFVDLDGRLAACPPPCSVEGAMAALVELKRNWMTHYAIDEDDPGAATMTALFSGVDVLVAEFARQA